MPSMRPNMNIYKFNLRSHQNQTLMICIATPTCTKATVYNMITQLLVRCFDTGFGNNLMYPGYGQKHPINNDIINMQVN